MFLLPFSSPNSPTKILKLFPRGRRPLPPPLRWTGAELRSIRDRRFLLVARNPALQKVLEASRMPTWAGCLAPLIAASCLLLVAGSHQEIHETGGSRILLQTNPHTHEVHCSRERSRAAWKAIDEYLMPFVEKEKYELPRKCRLHPDNDMFREQEQHKIHFDVNEWRCGFCKKAFRAEKFINQHFVNRHNNLVDNSEGRCLADLCGALHCDLTMEFKKPKSKCNAAAAARNHHL